MSETVIVCVVVIKSQNVLANSFLILKIKTKHDDDDDEDIVLPRAFWNSMNFCSPLLPNFDQLDSCRELREQSCPISCKLKGKRIDR